ncbi:uncharacterized protein LOC119769246 [Culex quinquefasciatus]|uniref:uncharacterized protein LOC119769246 n=1 Tax=Culex quinquefasciatus TaxID=7176 RepID=UPI0018E35916|nr:uncharacterized protein LOC119769246 [Culex quinquefasciatus]
MEGRCPVTRAALTAIVIVCWASLTSCYKLELEDAVKNDMRNLTCESYCTHCNCSGTFLEQENKCVCSCDDQTPTDPTCLAEIEGMRDLIGLNYAIEVRPEAPEQHVRVSRQTNSRRRTRNRRQRTGARRSRGRRPPRSRSRRGRRPGRPNLVGAPAPTPAPAEVVAAPAPVQ